MATLFHHRTIANIVAYIEYLGNGVHGGNRSASTTALAISLSLSFSRGDNAGMYKGTPKEAATAAVREPLEHLESSALLLVLTFQLLSLLA